MKGKKMSGFPERHRALSDFFGAWKPKLEEEWVTLPHAPGRVTMRALYSANTLPVYRCSACDGIAVHSASFQDDFPDTSTWRPGVEYERADTGDDFSDKYDAIIPIEEVEEHADGSVTISADVPVEAGWNTMARGATIREGDLLIEADRPIRPWDLASLSLGGAVVVPVHKKPVVAFIPTGNELIPQGMKPNRGENVDTNSIMAEAMLREMGAEPVLFPIVKDHKKQLVEAVETALAISDFVILNGGTALGAEDFNFALELKNARTIHHYIAAAPGRPLAMMVVGDKPVINLPGPTVGAFFGMEWCIRSIISRLLNIPVPQRPTVDCILQDEITAHPDMAILCNLRITKNAAGELLAHPVSFHSSGTAAALATNGLYIKEVGVRKLEKGSSIKVQLMRGEEYIEQEA